MTWEFLYHLAFNKIPFFDLARFAKSRCNTYLTKYTIEIFWKAFKTRLQINGLFFSKIILTMLNGDSWHKSQSPFKKVHHPTWYVQYTQQCELLGCPVCRISIFVKSYNLELISTWSPLFSPSFRGKDTMQLLSQQRT